MSKDNKSECKLCFLDGLGGVLLFLCSVCLIVVFVDFYRHEPDKPIVNEISLSFQADSSRVLDYESFKAIDSLITIVKHQQEDIHQRYVYFIEQKEHENGLITFAGIIISIILGIFGFFGYKSFKSIEDKALLNAEEKVKVKVDAEIDSIKETIETELIGKINNRFKTEYETRLGDEVTKKMVECYNENIMAKLSFIELKDETFKDYQTRLDNVEQFVSQLRDEGVIIRSNFTEETGGDLGILSGDRKMKRASQTDKEEEG